MAPFARARRLLDEVQHQNQLDALEPARFAAALEAETPPTGTTLAQLAAGLDGGRGLLEEIDRFTEKAMRIRLHQLDAPVPAQLRTLVATTLVGYAADPARLRGRLADILARVDRAAAAATTERIMEAAERTLATRQALRDAVTALAARMAAAWLPVARRAASDRTQADDERERWARARVDLEQVAGRGAVVETAGHEERLGQIAAPADEPEDPIAKRFSLLEFD
jgi:hypothetical protein